MPNSDFDSPWKEILERYLPAFLEFFFPAAAAGIDWRRGYEFLDKELQQLAPKGATGRRTVDKLVRVWRKDGAETWVLIHIEVQGVREAAFARRMFVYHSRLFLQFQRPLVSLALLTDTQPRWCPEQFGYGLWGCTLEFHFPTAKLLAYRERWNELESSHNVFAIVVMAHLQTLATRGDDASRYAWKMRLIRSMYERGYRRQEIQDLFWFIDWVMRLPDELEDELWQELQQYEQEKRMRYVSSVERIGMRKGMEKGMEKGLEVGIAQGLLIGLEPALKLKFGRQAMELRRELAALQDIETLKRISAALEKITTPDELRALYRSAKPARRPGKTRARKAKA